MIIKVEQRHIDKGVRSNCEACPIALAVLEQYPDAHAVTVDDDIVAGIDEFDAEHCVRFHMSTAALDFMCDFDEGRAVKPFEFELDESKRRDYDPTPFYND
jgi:hypothetical protein